MADEPKEPRVLDFAERLALYLFTDATGERASRLALIAPTGRDMGGWCFEAVVQAIRAYDDAR